MLGVARPRRGIPRRRSPTARIGESASPDAGPSLIACRVGDTALDAKREGHARQRPLEHRAGVPGRARHDTDAPKLGAESVTEDAADRVPAPAPADRRALTASHNSDRGYD